MGWLAVCAVVPLFARIGMDGMIWVAAGGVLYTAGILFFIKDTRWRHAHGIWHLFVLGGSTRISSPFCATLADSQPAFVPCGADGADSI